MRFLGNLIWFVCGGLITGLGWTLAGFILSVTIIGLPFGMQCFKIAGFVLWPFGRVIEGETMGFGGLLGNLIWIVLFGWELALAHLVLGVFFYLTILGIPFGHQHLKFAALALTPFGSVVRRV